MEIEIFKAGKWGDDIYTEQDLDSIVEGFTGYECPIILNHIRVGYIDSIYRIGNRLMAKLSGLTNKARELLEKKSFKRMLRINGDIKRFLGLNLISNYSAEYSLPGSGGIRNVYTQADYEPEKEGEDTMKDLGDIIESKRREYSEQGKQLTDMEIIEIVKREYPDLWAIEYASPGQVLVYHDLSTDDMTMVNKGDCPNCRGDSSLVRVKYKGDLIARCKLCNTVIHSVPEYVLDRPSKMSLADKMVKLAKEKNITLAQAVEMLKDDPDCYDDFKSYGRHD